MREQTVGHHGAGASSIFVREWSEKDSFNSFNNWKGLLYKDKYKGIAEAIRRRKYRPHLPAPVEARIDLTLRCNLNCAWCNSAQYRKRGHELDVDFVKELIDFLVVWKVRGICWAGGGEPSIHPYFNEIITYAAEKGLSQGLLSNGTARKRSIHETVGKYTRWAGISVDAGVAKTYKKIKGVDLFNRVLENLTIMAENAVNCNVGYKFLVSPLNQYEIYYACEQAKKIGVRDFIARPVDIHHQGMARHDTKLEDFNQKSIFTQFEECHKLTDDNFHVYTVMHKFNPDFSHSKPFKQCYAAPLKLQLAPNRDIYFCDDQFYREKYKLGTATNDPYSILPIWGNEKHLSLLCDDTPKKCKTRCCIGDYNIQIEKLFINNDDPMCVDFP